MIPKIIHFCWFGRNPLPDSTLKCISSWKKFFPDYEIKEWNEDNFDVFSIPYTEEAYKLGKFAFVSDFARFKILYEQGGLYFDTDVEIIKPFNEILKGGSFMGFEIAPCNDRRYPKYDFIAVNPGLGIGFEKNHPFLKEMIDYYATLSFTTNDKIIPMTICEHTTNQLYKYGIIDSKEVQNVCGIKIYPPDWFNPYDPSTGRVRKTSNTHSIHWYSKSWSDNKSKLRDILSHSFHRIFGVNTMRKLRKFVKKK